MGFVEKAMQESSGELEDKKLSPGQLRKESGARNEHDNIDAGMNNDGSFSSAIHRHTAELALSIALNEVNDSPRAKNDDDVKRKATELKIRGRGDGKGSEEVLKSPYRRNNKLMKDKKTEKEDKKPVRLGRPSVPVTSAATSAEIDLDDEEIAAMRAPALQRGQISLQRMESRPGATRIAGIDGLDGDDDDDVDDQDAASSVRSGNRNMVRSNADVAVADLVTAELVLEKSNRGDDVTSVREKLNQKLRELESMAARLEEMEAMKIELTELRERVSGAVPAEAVIVEPTKPRGSLAGWKEDELHALSILLGEEVDESSPPLTADVQLRDEAKKSVAKSVGKIKSTSSSGMNRSRLASGPSITRGRSNSADIERGGTLDFASVSMATVNGSMTVATTRTASSQPAPGFSETEVVTALQQSNESCCVIL